MASLAGLPLEAKKCLIHFLDHPARSNLLVSAAQVGHTGFVAELIPLIGFEPVMGGVALVEAAKNGHVGAMRVLLSRREVSDWMAGSALESAATNGHAEAVRLLLKSRTIIPIHREIALEIAIENGHTGVVQILTEEDDICWKETALAVSILTFSILGWGFHNYYLK